MKAVVIPAAMEITTCPSWNSLAHSSRTRAMACGFTASTTKSLWATRALLSTVVRIP